MRQPFIWRNTIQSLVDQVLGRRWLRLNYDDQTGAFVIGETVTGDGGAEGVVTYVEDVSDTGVLFFASITGTYVDDEGLTGDAVGAAVANGTQY